MLASRHQDDIDFFRIPTTGPQYGLPRFAAAYWDGFLGKVLRSPAKGT